MIDALFRSGGIRRQAVSTFARAAAGVTTLEFAIVMPVFLLMVLGGLELGYASFIKAVLEGEMQRVARSRTLESASSDQQNVILQTRVTEMVRKLAPKAEVSFSRKAFRDYSGAVTGKEHFTDANNNGRCDEKEVFEDENHNGRWDDAGRVDSDGGARDVVIFTASIAYEGLPTAGILTFGRPGTLDATTALRNQPFDQQLSAPEVACL